jgi:hypothetical protein
MVYGYAQVGAAVTVGSRPPLFHLLPYFSRDGDYCIPA